MEGVASLSRLLPHISGPSACRSILQLAGSPRVGPGGGSPVPVVGRKDARPLPRGGSHLSDSALPTRRARRKSRPGRRAPPARALPWPPRCRSRTSPSAAAAAAPTGPERRGRAATGGRSESPPRPARVGDGGLGVRPEAPACRLQARGCLFGGTFPRKPKATVQRTHCFLTEGGGLSAKPEIP